MKDLFLINATQRCTDVMETFQLDAQALLYLRKYERSVKADVLLNLLEYVCQSGGLMDSLLSPLSLIFPLSICCSAIPRSLSVL